MYAVLFVLAASLEVAPHSTLRAAARVPKLSDAVRQRARSFSQKSNLNPVGGDDPHTEPVVGPGADSKKIEGPMSEQGVTGKAVQHEDMSTQTSDWRCEYGPCGPEHPKPKKVDDSFWGKR